MHQFYPLFPPKMSYKIGDRVVILKNKGYFGSYEGTDAIVVKYYGNGMYDIEAWDNRTFTCDESHIQDYNSFYGVWGNDDDDELDLLNEFDKMLQEELNKKEELEEEKKKKQYMCFHKDAYINKISNNKKYWFIVCPDCGKDIKNYVSGDENRYKSDPPKR